MNQQEPLPMFDFSDAVGSYARGEAGAQGAIFTRREVVEHQTKSCADRANCEYRGFRALWR
jgi:hypothetical protein